jgi:rhamnose utilization protein RhaD (predicted bifunctional aldolase and dehydrogenase)
MTDEATRLLEEITALSHEFGTTDHVLGGGGNTSCKTTDTLWIKPSGTRLSGLTPEAFVAVDADRLSGLYRMEIPPDASAREEAVKQAMLAAVRPGAAGRPSVETPLHAVLDGRFVVHTHATLVNGLTCAHGGADACEKLFPEALWTPYTDPGFTLCVDVRRRVEAYTAARGRAPRLLILENHGIFVSGDSAEEIRTRFAAVMDHLREAYRQAGVPITLRPSAPPAGAAVADAVARIRTALGAPAAEVVHAPPCRAAEGPLTPDHIVYARSFFHHGPISAESVAAFAKKRGYPPRVFVAPEGLFAADVNPRTARLALDLALDGALVVQLADAFGGVRYLDDRARAFIENWEVESYRQKQAG